MARVPIIGWGGSRSIVPSYSIPDDVVPIAGSYRIRSRIFSLRPACFVAARFFSYLIGRRRACLRPAPRLAGRGVPSARFCCFPTESNMRCRCGFGCLLVLVPSPRLVGCVVLRFLLASRRFLLCRLISSPVVSLGRLPDARHGGRGVGRGASVSLLAWFCPGFCRCR